MKHLPCILLALVLGASVTRAQSYSITSGKITGGGGVSSGTGPAGTFAMTGTIAQPEAHPASTGGTYSLSGGFFSQYIAVQRLGAPRLIIRPNGANVELVWASNVPGWVLQTNTADLNSASWADVAGAPSLSEPEQYHTFPMGPGRVFYRLRLK